MANILDGYQTYILAVLIMVAGALWHFGWIDGDTFVTIMTLLTGGALASTRWAIHKTDQKLYFDDQYKEE